MMMYRYSKQTIFILFLLCIQLRVVSQSKFSSGIGTGLNLSKFYLSEADVLFPDPMSANLGFGFRINSEYAINPGIGINLEIGYSIMDSRALKKNNRISNNLDIPFYLSFRMPGKIDLNTGVIYQYLLSFRIGGWGNTEDVTWLARNRHFINPYLGCSYNISEKLSITLEGAYAFQETFRASTQDYNNNEIFDLPAKRHYIGIMLWYKH